MEQKKNIMEAVSKISTIPTLPVVVERITRLLQNPQTSAEEIGRAITTDQALAAKVLKLVNSAFYGFPGRISTITHAVVILGFSTIKNIVLTASIFDTFKRKAQQDDQFDIEKFWFHSIACGAASQAIAKQTGATEREECFIAGLIHDIGKIILFQYLQEEFTAVFNHARTHQVTFFESEKELFGDTHQEIGGLLSEVWNLPKNLQNAIRHHHDPATAQEGYTVTAIVHTADILVRALDMGNPGDNGIPELSEAVWNNLGIEDNELQALLSAIEDEVDKAKVFMQI